MQHKAQNGADKTDKRPQIIGDRGHFIAISNAHDANGGTCIHKQRAGYIKGGGFFIAGPAQPVTGNNRHGHADYHGGYGPCAVEQQAVAQQGLQALACACFVESRAELEHRLPGLQPGTRGERAGKGMDKDQNTVIAQAQLPRGEDGGQKPENRADPATAQQIPGIAHSPGKGRDGFGKRGRQGFHKLQLRLVRLDRTEKAVDVKTFSKKSPYNLQNQRYPSHFIGAHWLECIQNGFLHGVERKMILREIALRPSLRDPGIIILQ